MLTRSVVLEATSHTYIMASNYTMDQREDNCIGASTNFTTEETLITFIISAKYIVIIAAVCGNSLVIAAFYKFSNLRTSSNVILVSLCTADSLIVIAFIISISRMSLYLSYHDAHMFKRVCEVEAWFSFTLISVIILHLALISVERLIAVKFSLRYHTIVTKRRALIASIAVWLWAVAVTLSFHKCLQKATTTPAETLFVLCIHASIPNVIRVGQHRS